MGGRPQIMKYHNLTRGGKAYLREQGVSEEEFSRMGDIQQQEWLEEIKLGSYDRMRQKRRCLTSKKYY